MLELAKKKKKKSRVTVSSVELSAKPRLLRAAHWRAQKKRPPTGCTLCTRRLRPAGSLRSAQPHPVVLRQGRVHRCREEGGAIAHRPEPASLLSYYLLGLPGGGGARRVGVQPLQIVEGAEVYSQHKPASGKPSESRGCKVWVGPLHAEWGFNYKVSSRQVPWFPCASQKPS